MRIRRRMSIACCTMATRSRLGGTVLTAHLTAGHTGAPPPGPWTKPKAAALLHVVIVGSPNVNPGYKLVGNTVYPQIAADYKHQFQVLKALALRHLSRRARRLLRPDGKISALEGRRPKTPSSIPPATRPTSPIASRPSRRSWSASPGSEN
jgi:hypothetical protein